jgi:hypothetical protein
MGMRRQFGRLFKDREVIVFLVVEVFVSVCIVFFTWKATEDKKEALLWALSGICLLWILTGRLQLAFLKSEMEHHFIETERALDSVAGLRTTAFKDAALAKDLKTIVAGAGQALEYEEPEFREYIRKRANTFAVEMGGLVDGVLRASASVSSTWAMERLVVSREVFATTFSKSISTFWASPGGREYLQANIAAHRDHHVKITRAFILHDNIFAASNVNVIRQHVINGLEAWVVRQTDLEPGSVEDFIAFDFKYVAFWDSAHASDELSYARWSTNATYTSRARDIREYLQFRSEKLKTEAELEIWLKSGSAIQA